MKKNKRLSKKQYIILGCNKNGEIVGDVECSFSMSPSNERVRVYSEERGDIEFSSYWMNEYKKVAKKMLRKPNKRHKKTYYKSSSNTKYRIAIKAPKSPNQNLWHWLSTIVEDYNYNHRQNCVWKVFRVGKHCPVEVDPTEWMKMRGQRLPYNTYNWRNWKFTRKPDVEF